MELDGLKQELLDQKHAHTEALQQAESLQEEAESKQRDVESLQKQVSLPASPALTMSDATPVG